MRLLLQAGHVRSPDAERFGMHSPTASNCPGVRRTDRAARLSSRWLRQRVPGSGTMRSGRARSQARSRCADVQPTSAARSHRRWTRVRSAARLVPWKHGWAWRTSSRWRLPVERHPGGPVAAAMSRHAGNAGIASQTRPTPHRHLQETGPRSVPSALIRAAFALPAAPAAQHRRLRAAPCGLGRGGLLPAGRKPRCTVPSMLMRGGRAAADGRWRQPVTAWQGIRRRRPWERLRW